MPSTASTRNTDGDRLRSRPVAPRSARPAVSGAEMPGAGIAAELPPILFRLPALVRGRLDAEQRAVGDVQASVAIDARASSKLDVTKSTQESSCAADKSMPNSIPQPHAHQATIETFAAPSNFVNATSGEAVIASETPAEAAPVAVASTAPNRTWWEHWSSGVVLILLVIALVTASIIALNDGGRAKSDHLASQAESSMLDEFDLSSITIPEITVPTMASTNNSTPAESLSTVTALTLGTSAAPSINPSDQTGAIAPVGAVPQLATTTTGPGERAGSTSGTPGVRADEALKLTATAVPTLSAPTDTQEPLTTLARPIGVAAPQLFTNSEYPSNASLGVPSVTASNPTASLELPSGVSSATTAYPISAAASSSTTDGSSPTFYDGASRMAQQHAAAGNAGGQSLPTVSGSATMPVDGFVHSAEGPIDTNMLSYPAILASTMTDASGVGSPSQSVFTTASHTQPANPSTSLSPSVAGPAITGAAAQSQYTSQYANPTPTAAVVPSRTPDLNGNSLLNEYFKYDKMRQAGEGKVDNRYPDSTTIAPHQNASSQSPASSSPGSGTGFTLGNPQAAAPAAPPLPR